MSSRFKPGHAKVGGRKVGSPNKRQVIEVPVPLEKIPSITETLLKYKVDPALEILKLCGIVPNKDGKTKCELLPHQVASVMLQLEGLKKREAGPAPEPQTPESSTGAKTTTDELLNRVLKATHEDQIRRQTVTG